MNPYRILVVHRSQLVWNIFQYDFYKAPEVCLKSSSRVLSRQKKQSSAVKLCRVTLSSFVKVLPDARRTE